MAAAEIALKSRHLDGRCGARSVHVRNSPTMRSLIHRTFDSSNNSSDHHGGVADHGTLSLFAQAGLTGASGTGASGDPLSVTGSLYRYQQRAGERRDLYAEFSDAAENDHISLTVDDGSGTDTLNVVFNQSGTAGTLEGTAGKDVIYAPGGQNTILTVARRQRHFRIPPGFRQRRLIRNGGAQDFASLRAGNPAGEADHIQLDGFTSYSSFADIAPHISE